MGLMPAEFWSLTVAEFHIKHGAFVRSEDRKLSLVYQLASMVAMADQKARDIMLKNANTLKRYPIKPWLFED